METEENREEGEISDDDDVIITQVTRGRHQRDFDIDPLLQYGKTRVKHRDKYQNKRSNKSIDEQVLERRESNTSSLFPDKLVICNFTLSGLSEKNVDPALNGTNASSVNVPCKGTVIADNRGVIPTVQTESPCVSTPEKYSSMRNANTCPAEIFSPIRISTSESPDGSSGFIDKMRARGTSLLSPCFSPQFSAQAGSFASADITSLTQDVDLASIPAPPFPKPHINSNAYATVQVIDLASIPTPAPPPLPNTPPPSVPLPPPEDPAQDNSSSAVKSSADDIDDDFVDSLLEEATKQMQKDLDDMQDKTEVVDMELESSDEGEVHDDTDTHIILTNPPGMEDEDEDLDVLELRLAALASYAKSTRRALEEKDDSTYDPERPLMSQYKHASSSHSSSHGRDSTVRKRKRSGNYDDSSSSRKRYQDERREREKRLRAEERLRREEERRARVEDAYRRERHLREEEKRETRRLQEVEQKLNELQSSMNPENMLQKMLQMVGAKNSDKKPNELLSLFAQLVDDPASVDNKASVVSKRERNVQTDGVLKSESAECVATPGKNNAPLTCDIPDIYSNEEPAAADSPDLAAGLYSEDEGADCLSLGEDSDSGAPVQQQEDHSDFANLEGDIFTKVDKNLPAAASGDVEEKTTRIFPKQQSNIASTTEHEMVEDINVHLVKNKHPIEMAPDISVVIHGCPDDSGLPGCENVDDWLYGGETLRESSRCTTETVLNVESNHSVDRGERLEESNQEVPKHQSCIENLNSEPSEMENKSKVDENDGKTGNMALSDSELPDGATESTCTAEHEHPEDTESQTNNSFNQTAIEPAKFTVENGMSINEQAEHIDIEKEPEKYVAMESNVCGDTQLQNEISTNEETHELDDSKNTSHEVNSEDTSISVKEAISRTEAAQDTSIEDIPEPDNDEIDAAILRAQLLASLKPRSPRTDASSQGTRSGPGSTLGVEEATKSSIAVGVSPKDSPKALTVDSPGRSPKGSVTGSGGSREMEKKKSLDFESQKSPRAKSKKRSKDDARSEDEDESLMRAQLLASVAKIRRERLEAEIAKNDEKIQAKSKLVESVVKNVSKPNEDKSSTARRSPRQQSGSRRRSPPRKNGAKLQDKKSRHDKSNNKAKTKIPESKSKGSVRSKSGDLKVRTDHASVKKDGRPGKRVTEKKTGKENIKEKGSALEVKSFSKTSPASLSALSRSTVSKGASAIEETISSTAITTTDSISKCFLSNGADSMNGKNVVLTPKMPPPIFQETTAKTDDLNTSFDLPISDALLCRLGGISTNVGPVPASDVNVVVPPQMPPGIAYDPLIPPLPSVYMSSIAFPAIPTQTMTPHITTGEFPATSVHQSSRVMDIQNPALFPQTVMPLPVVYPSNTMTQPPKDVGFSSVNALQRAPTVSLSKEMSKSISDISSIGIGLQEQSGSIERQIEIMKPKAVLMEPKAVSSESDRKVEIVKSIDTLSQRKSVKKKSSIESIRIEKVVSYKETGVNFEDVPDEINSQRSKQDVKVKFIPHKTKIKKGVSFPIVKPVVINLEEDTSDDDDYDTPMTSQTSAASTGGGLLGSLDSFLKEARASVEQQQKHKAAPTTPEALKNLGPHGVAEYKKLREEIRKREEKLKASQAAKKATAVIGGKGATGQGSEEAGNTAEDAKKVHQLELRVQLQKKMLDQDEQNLNTLTSLVDKKKNVRSLADKKMKQLQKQLEATRRIYQTNVEQIGNLEEKCQSCKKQIGDRHVKIKDLQKEMLEKGRQTFGSNYIPFQSSNPKLFEQEASPDQKTKPQKEPEVNEKGDSNTDTPNTHTLDKAHHLSIVTSQTGSAANQNDEDKEREELEKLHQQYADMIRRHKEELKRQSEKVDHAAKQRVPQKPEHIHTEENIKVASADTDSLAFEVVKPRKRRRSIMGSVQGALTRPYLSPVKEPLKKKVKELSEAGSSSRESSPKPGSAMPPGGFKMPTGQHMSRLCKLHKENLEKEAWFSKQTVQPLSQSQQAFQPVAVLSVIPGAKYKPKTLSNRQSSVQTSEPPLSNYVSPLLRFKSYRLNPYFRTKAGVHPLSLTFSNKIDPKRMFCHFELTGKCNDDKCPWLHKQGIQMSVDEVLEDLVAYTPPLAGVSHDALPEAYPKKIQSYVSGFRAQNAALAAEQQVTLMTMHVNNQAKHAVPHTTFTEPRAWKPHVPGPPEETDKESICSFIVDTNSAPVPENTKVWEDDILCESDMRYYLLGSEDVQDMEADMEAGVLEDPSNITLWLKLAYKKLHHVKESSDESIDQALNVLSRALESKRTSSELWLHYLGVYSKRKDKSDLLMLSQQALKYAPSYQLHWKYLSALPLISQKRFHCNKIEEFLSSAKCSDSEDVKSHYLLEIILYRVQLCIISGRTNSALKTMREKCNSSLNALTLADAVLFCMCYIHMLDFRSLPPSMFEAGNTAPGRIVNKEPFVIEWKTKGATYVSTIREFVVSCRGHAQFEEARGHDTLLPLYNTLLQYRHANGLVSGVRAMCTQLDMQDVPLSLRKLDLHADPPAHTANLLQLYADTLKHAPCTDVRLVYDTVSVMISCKKTDEALELLEKVPFRFFDVPDETNHEFDPNQLYCKLLKQELPLNAKLPAINEEVVQQLNRAHVWACYCLLQELQGFEVEVEQCYENAVASPHDLHDLRFIWKCYLQYCHKLLSNIAQTAQTKTGKQTSQPLLLQRQFQSFTRLVKRCLVAMPTKFPLPHQPDSQWLDYSFHSEVVDMYASVVDKHEKLHVYEDFVKLMPLNVELIIRACEFYYAYGAKTLALGTSRVALEDFKTCLPLWKLHLKIASEINTPKEVLRLYKRATHALPHALWLWTNYLLLASTCGKEEHVKQILQKCKDLEIHLVDFATTVLK